MNPNHSFFFRTWVDRTRFDLSGGITTPAPRWATANSALSIWSNLDLIWSDQILNLIWSSLLLHQGLIFVVDCADRDRIDEARQELHRFHSISTIKKLKQSFIASSFQDHQRQGDARCHNSHICGKIREKILKQLNHDFSVSEQTGSAWSNETPWDTREVGAHAT